MMVLLPSGLTVDLSAQPVKMRQKPDPAKFELAVSLIKNSKDFMEGTIFPTMDLDTGYYQAKICPTT